MEKIYSLAAKYKHAKTTQEYLGHVLSLSCSVSLLCLCLCLSLSHQFKVVAEAVLLQHPKTHDVERREDPTTSRLLLVCHLALL